MYLRTRVDRDLRKVVLREVLVLVVADDDHRVRPLLPHLPLEKRQRLTDVPVALLPYVRSLVGDVGMELRLHAVTRLVPRPRPPPHHVPARGLHQRIRVGGGHSGYDPAHRGFLRAPVPFNGSPIPGSSSIVIPLVVYQAATLLQQQREAASSIRPASDRRRHQLGQSASASGQWPRETPCHGALGLRGGSSSSSHSSRARSM